MTAHALLHELYESATPRAERFRYGLLALDVLLFIYLITISFTPEARFIPYADATFALIFLTDFLARFSLKRFSLRYLLSLDGIIDIVILLSFALTYFGSHLTFLRALRFIRLLRGNAIRKQLCTHSRFFNDNEEIIIATSHLALFIFIMTSLVFETQHRNNDSINDFIDALYFTVTTLTTTGFGDVTLKGDSGKLLAVCIMIFGVSLFIRLIQAMFRAHKVRHHCPNCGLEYHDRDAVHCKACGIVLNIRDEGTI